MEIRKLACTMSALFTASACILTASAEKVEERAFPSYTYSLWGSVSDCPAPYTLEGRITGVDLGLSDFRQINDLFADQNGRVYEMCIRDRSYTVSLTVSLGDFAALLGRTTDCIQKLNEIYRQLLMIMSASPDRCV